MDQNTREPRREGCNARRGVEQFYVKRVNWLIDIGRTDLIGEIAEDCQHQRARAQGETLDGESTPRRTAAANDRRDR